jgi:hypothetical protein
MGDPLVDIATDVWHLPAAPLKLPGGVRMPLASTVIRLPDRSLLLYSPVALDDAAVAALASVGEVAHIVAPSLLHHLWAKPALDRFPRAVLHGTPGLAAKRTDLPIERELGAPDPAWSGAVDVVVIGGAPRLNEAVLFHRPSGTLVCADFVFNVTNPANLRTRFVLRMMGVAGRHLAQSRVWKLAVRDRAAARTTIDRVLSWPIERVSPVHGEPVAIDSAAFAPVVERAYGRALRRQLAAPTAPP